MARNFIQETIDNLSKSSNKIDGIWKLFQIGKLTKSEFEEQYKNILYNCYEDIESEKEFPNNGCKYSNTCPTSVYFKTENI